MNNREEIIKKCQECIDSGEPPWDYSFYYGVIELLKEQESNHGNCKDCMNASEDCTGTFWCAAYDIPVTPKFYCAYFEER